MSSNNARNVLAPCFTQTEVLSRPGWSKGVLLKLLGEPDVRKRTFRRANPAALYLESRVFAAETSDAFLSLQASLAARKASAAKAVLTTINKLLAAVDAMRVQVVLLPLPDLQRGALDSYNARRAGTDRWASHESDAEFLNRITVNFIRHDLTHYDYELWAVAGKKGVSKAVDSIRLMVYDAIAEAYPTYADECSRQYLERQQFDLRI